MPDKGCKSNFEKFQGVTWEKQLKEFTAYGVENNHLTDTVIIFRECVKIMSIRVEIEVCYLEVTSGI